MNSPKILAKSSNNQSNNKTYAIRFGLGAIKAVGFNMMQEAVKEREKNGKFKDIYDFAKRLDPRSINKKSIEALAKAGAFDNINPNRRQISESFDILSNYANEVKKEANSNQMNLFGSIADDDAQPALKATPTWNKTQILKNEFEAFGFFLNEHPIDNKIKDLKLRGVVFSSKIDDDNLTDNSIIHLAGVVASSKHRSGSRGRFAYINISDPFGIYETIIYDEALITANRDILEDGSEIIIECLVRKDDGGTRMMIKNVFRVEDFIKDTKPAEKEFENIKKLPNKKNFGEKKFGDKKNGRDFENNNKVPSSNMAQNNNQNSAQNKTFQANKNNHPTPQENPTNNRNDATNIDDNRQEKKITKLITQLEIKITDQKALLPLKTIILQKISPEGNADIFLLANNNSGEIAKIKLNGKYKIQEIDLFRLKNLHRDIIISAVSYDI